MRGSCISHLCALLVCALPGSAQVAEVPSGWSLVGGRVTDAGTGEPLEGVRVDAHGIGLDVSSHPNGEFTLGNVRPGRLWLVFSRLGYADREVSLEIEPARRVELLVEMTTEPIELDPIEVSVVRLAAVERKDPRALSASTVLESFGAAQNVMELLQWHVPGVQVSTDRTGQVSVLIRGMSSLLSQGPPLVILDGVPVDRDGLSWVLRSIHLSQIERIEVLRDVASTSFYGTRGAHGVVLIDLKRR